MRLKAPHTVTGASIAGVFYPVEDGHIEVPSEHADDLASHGFTPAPLPEAPAKTKKVKVEDILKE